MWAQEANEQLRREQQGLSKQRDRMEALCRTLTVERTALRRRLGIARRARTLSLSLSFPFFLCAHATQRVRVRV